MKKLLIYGFKPYKEYKTNISEAIIKRLIPRKGFKIRKVILPVVFKKDILRKVQRFKPDVIIGLGQKPRGKLLEIEKTARNIYKTDRLKAINPKRPKKYFLNTRLKGKPKGIRIDYISSDDYVCNFTRYIIMDFIKKNKLKTRFTFIHIPKNYNFQKAAKIIQEVISGI